MKVSDIEVKVPQSVIEAGKKKAEELEIPFEVPAWLMDVPADKQEGALCRSVENARKKIGRDMLNASVRDQRKAESREIMDKISKAGYELFYVTLNGYRIAVAHRTMLEDEAYGDKVVVYFATCSVEDVKRFSRAQSREKLLVRIKNNDPKYRVMTTVPRDTGREKLMIFERIMDRALADPSGLPHQIAQAIREGADRFWEGVSG
jgi:hypothetical protein